MAPEVISVALRAVCVVALRVLGESRRLLAGSHAVYPAHGLSALLRRLAERTAASHRA